MKHQRKMLCSFCLNNNIEHIYNAKIKNSIEVRSLYKCNQCGNFFWEDTGEEVEWLSRLCKTRWIDPEKCSEDILNFFPQQGGINSNLEKIKELDKRCSECPNKNFMLDSENK